MLYIEAYAETPLSNKHPLSTPAKAGPDPNSVGSRPPEQGNVVVLRHKAWVVTDVVKTKGPTCQVHRVSLECLSDEGLGRPIDVIWEREIAPALLEASALPLVRGLDTPARFTAFLDALRWSSASLAEGTAIQAPFRGGVQMEEYQLAPVLRAIQMPRVRLLIADDVGLGKTIEAGLIAQELIHSHRASRILVLCPAHLKVKWAEEMGEKFGLEFRIIDRDAVLRMRREFGPTINPWASFPRLITSIDYLKTEQPRRLFEELLDRRRKETGSKPWDLLILDEAHNVGPAGRGRYIRDSDRTTLMRAIADHFEHKVFLTATPHNGYRESFTGLLELLDNLRFSRGIELDRDQLQAVTIRRLKTDLQRPDGRPRFPPRVVLPKSPEEHPDLYVDLSGQERELFDLLQAYTRSRLAEVDKPRERPTQFALTLLKKRALSSPLALRESLVTHTSTVGVREELGIGDSLFRTLEQREDEDWSDDEEREDLLEAALEAASRLCRPLSAEEKGSLKRMFEIADGLRRKADSKASALLRWIEANLRSGGSWNGERLIVFTEYRHTLAYLQDMLSQAGYGEALLSIYGGMPDEERQEINAAFQAPLSEHPVRILLATDAASEGSDFQRYCRNIIHYEIPWNPVRLEQRNGRIDRHGQQADEVRIHHFVFRNHEDSEFLKRIVEKVETIRSDLGSVGSLIAESVRQHALGQRIDLASIDNDTRRKLARKEMELSSPEGEEAAAMVKALATARRQLGVTDERQTNVLREAMTMEGESAGLANVPAAVAFTQSGGFAVAEGGGTYAAGPPQSPEFTLSRLPPAWSECRRFLSRPDREIVLTFDRSTAGESASTSVLHLDHPLMRRSIATLRSQLWRVGSAVQDGLHRVAAQRCASVKTPILIAWGRLLLVGPERNQLHEGIFAAAGSVNSSLTPFPQDQLESLLGEPTRPYEGLAQRMHELVSPHLAALQELLTKRSMEEAAEIERVLTARGGVAERQARSLATERIGEIRRTLQQWEKEAASAQLKLFDDEERSQRDTDIHALRQRLAELEAEREREPKRQRALYKVADRRVYPAALQILLPARGF